MKSFISVVSVLLVLIVTSVPEKVCGQHTSVSIQVFYDELSPYGQWVHDPAYGYVWIPDAGPGFYPYADHGHWVLTAYGWTWVSDYPWGWAPFHYGRWHMHSVYGPMWIPGYDWGPAWVCWRRSPGYYGWAPLEPGISISAGYSSYNPSPGYWRFVSERDFGGSNTRYTYVNQTENVTIIKNSTVINRTSSNTRKGAYIAGPDRKEVGKVTGAPVREVKIEESSKPGQKLDNESLKIYRPKVQDDKAAKHAPAKVVEYKDVKQADGRQAPVEKSSQMKGKPAPAKAEPGVKDQPPQSTDEPARVKTPAQQDQIPENKTAPPPAQSDPRQDDKAAPPPPAQQDPHQDDKVAPPPPSSPPAAKPQKPVKEHHPSKPKDKSGKPGPH